MHLTLDENSVNLALHTYWYNYFKSRSFFKKLELLSVYHISQNENKNNKSLN